MGRESLLAGRQNSPVPVEEGFGRLEPLEADSQVVLHFVGAVSVAGIAIGPIAFLEILFERQDLFLLPPHVLGPPGDLPVEMLDIDLLLGNDFQRLVDGRHQLVDHRPGPLDVEFQGDFLADRLPSRRPSRVGITDDILAEDQRSERHGNTGSNDGLFQQHVPTPLVIRNWA